MAAAAGLLCCDVTIRFVTWYADRKERGAFCRFNTFSLFHFISRAYNVAHHYAHNLFIVDTAFFCFSFRFHTFPRPVLIFSPPHVAVVFFCFCFPLVAHPAGPASL